MSYAEEVVWWEQQERIEELEAQLAECREELAAAWQREWDAQVGGYDGDLDDAVLAQREQLAELERELAECQEKLVAAAAELAECKRELAAARDRERDLIASMRSYRDEVHEDLARADAALEQARQEGKYAGYRSCSDELLDRIEQFPEELEQALAEGAAEERERCAQIAEDWDWRKSGDNTSSDIAAAIRALQGGTDGT